MQDVHVKTVSPRASEATHIERARAFSAAAFDDPLAAVLGRAAVVAVVAGLVVQIRGFRLSCPTRVADDLDGRHGRLRSVLGGHQSPRLWTAFTSEGGNRVSGRFRRNLRDAIC
ncbi:hypothetical protein BJS_02551 [Bradyrhizobium japonicum SEMIA 5079]|nr:hypothetical protein BJS_02551 [Bradyrhizobium japonicum SEMIA 5079]